MTSYSAPGILNETDQPIAAEDTTIMQQESVVPYPVINTVDVHPIEVNPEEDFEVTVSKKALVKLYNFAFKLADKLNQVPELHKIDLELNTPVDTKPTHNMESQTEQPTLTFGEKATGISFNPGGHPEVNEVKRMFADLIDKINDLRSKSESPDAKRYYSTAITEAEKSQMLAVKAITWQY